MKIFPNQYKVCEIESAFIRDLMLENYNLAEIEVDVVWIKVVSRRDWGRDWFNKLRDDKAQHPHGRYANVETIPYWRMQCVLAVLMHKLWK